MFNSTKEQIANDMANKPDYFRALPEDDDIPQGEDIVEEVVDEDEDDDEVDEDDEDDDSDVDEVEDSEEDK